MPTELAVMDRKERAQHQIAEELAPIRHLLKMLEDRIGQQPELDEANTRLQILMGRLTESSGGLL